MRAFVLIFLFTLLSFGGVTINTKGKTDEALINDEIRVKELLVISASGEKLGVISKDSALDMAYQDGLDLVLVSPDSNPPVAKIMDYSKYRFEQQKRLKEQKKKQKVIEVKEVQFTPTTEKHDFDTKVRKINDFISHGNKVKITLKFQRGRGRMAMHDDLCIDIINKIIEALGETISVEAQPKQEGRNYYAIVVPKKEKK